MPSNSFPLNLSLWPLRPYLSNFCPTHPTPGLPAIPQTHEAHAHLRALALAAPEPPSPELPQAASSIQVLPHPVHPGSGRNSCLLTSSTPCSFSPPYTALWIHLARGG